MGVNLVPEARFLLLVPVAFVAPLGRAHVAIKVGDCDRLVSQESGRSNVRDFGSCLLASFSGSILDTRIGCREAAELRAGT